MRSRTRTMLLTAAVSATLVASGCSLWKAQEASKAIDPPPADAEAQMEKSLGTTTGQTAAGTSATAPVTLYFKDGRGYVAPLTVDVPNTERIAQRSLEYMVEDGPAKTMLPKGFTALLPKGTKVNGINIVADQKLAVVDFSQSFTDYNPQDERKILEAVTWTLTGFPSIENVQIKVDGKPLKEMPVDGTPLDEPLSRAMGINLELATGVEIGQSTPVTVYFGGHNDDSFSYFVPVTRMIKRTDQLAQAVVDQLIRGPQPNKGLDPVLASGAALLGLNQMDDNSLVTVSFNDKLLGQDKKASPQALQAVVLSLTENTKAAKVQIAVGNDTKITAAGDDTNYTKPVSRPSRVNPVKM